MNKIKFYSSKEWRKCRLSVLIRDNYLCQICLSNGKLVPSNTVHHIKELLDFPELALDMDNLQSVCHHCHNSIRADREGLDTVRDGKRVITLTNKRYKF
jgi:5-methylcytosine-specific restriction enzyme A